MTHDFFSQGHVSEAHVSDTHYPDAHYPDAHYPEARWHHAGSGYDERSEALDGCALDGGSLDGGSLDEADWSMEWGTESALARDLLAAALTDVAPSGVRESVLAAVDVVFREAAEQVAPGEAGEAGATAPSGDAAPVTTLSGVFEKRRAATEPVASAPHPSVLSPLATLVGVPHCHGGPMLGGRCRSAPASDDAPSGGPQPSTSMLASSSALAANLPTPSRAAGNVDTAFGMPERPSRLRDSAASSVAGRGVAGSSVAGRSVAGSGVVAGSVVASSVANGALNLAQLAAAILVGIVIGKAAHLVMSDDGALAWGSSAPSPEGGLRAEPSRTPGAARASARAQASLGGDGESLAGDGESLEEVSASEEASARRAEPRHPRGLSRRGSGLRGRASARASGASRSAGVASSTAAGASDGAAAGAGGGAAEGAAAHATEAAFGMNGEAAGRAALPARALAVASPPVPLLLPAAVAVACASPGSSSGAATGEAPAAWDPRIAGGAPQLLGVIELPTVLSPMPTVLSPGAAPASDDWLGEQLAILSRAERSLLAGDPESAVRSLDEYRARFPGGLLDPQMASIRQRVEERFTAFIFP